MKTAKSIRFSLLVMSIALCLVAFCSAAVSVADVKTTVGPQATLTASADAASYQWYKCDDASGTNPTKLTDATGSSYTTDYLDTAGVSYYYVVADGVQSNVASVTATMPTEPIVLMFNNETDLANWYVGGGSEKALVDIDGIKAFSYLAKNDGSTTFSNLSKYCDFYLQGYPYIVVSASYPARSWNSLDVYLGTDRYSNDDRLHGFSSAYTGVGTVVNKGFCKTIIDATTGNYKSYSDGKVSISKTATVDGIGSPERWLGKLDTLRIDFSNGADNARCYIEYVGFFPTEAAALAYEGAMSEDASAQTVIDILENAETEGKFSLNFCDAENETSAAASVKALIESLTSDAVTTLETTYKTAEVNIANASYNRVSPYGSGTYTCDVQVLVGDKVFGRSRLYKKITVELKAKPDAVVMTFDTAEKVNAAYVAGADSKTFVAKGTTLDGEETAEDRSYMRLYKAEIANGNVEMNYVTFYEQTGKKFNYAEYPYMKISYRRNVPSTATSEKMMIYAANNKPSYYITHPATDDVLWEQMLVDMRDVGNGKVTYYRESGTATYGNLTYANSSLTWQESDIQAAITAKKDWLSFRLTRYGTAERTLDFEYIAFFASEDEAKMYPQALPSDASYDTEILEAKKNFNAADDVVTEAQAKAAAENYLKTFVFATKYNADFENAVFTAPTSTAVGSYVFDVWFGNEKKTEYTVTLTMTMAKLAEPIVMFTDNTVALQYISSDNAYLTVEDGVTKMNVRNSMNDDGFFLKPTLPGAMEPFPITTLPYLKMRYSISGLKQDTEGNAVRPSYVPAQIFFWMSDPSYSGLSSVAAYRTFYPYKDDYNDGDVLEIIVDMSYITAANANNTDMVWVRNVTKGETDYRGVKFVLLRNEDEGADKSFKRTSNTKYTSLRINLARRKDLERYAEFAYAGFFASLDEAKNFDYASAVEKRLEDTEKELKTVAENGAVITWGDIAKERTEIDDSNATLNTDGSFNIDGVKTQTVLAINGLREWVERTVGAGVNVTMNSYTAPTTQSKGSVNFDVVLECGYRTRKVENITVSIAEKPDDYIVWRFNDEAALDKISAANSNIKKIENNILKFSQNDPAETSSFSFWTDVASWGDTFMLQDHSYILIKHKRSGDLSRCIYNFSTQEGTSGNVDRIGWGRNSGDWYYTLIDTNIRDKVTPWVYNYDIDTGVLEKDYVYPKLSPPSTAKFRGEAKGFSFTFGSAKYAEKTLEIEYIAFFPSMADARDYVENKEAWDKLTSNTAVQLKNYSEDEIYYYDGNTQDIAQAKAKAIIADKISDKSVNVTVTTVSYTAPTLEAASGTYVFTAQITKDGKTVYTTDNITLTIGSEKTNSAIVYKFANPEFIKTIDGASNTCDYIAMKLEEGAFTLVADATKPNVNTDVYKVMKLDADFNGGFTALVNGSEILTYDGDGTEGGIYLEIGKIDANVNSIKFVFNNANDVKVRAIGFFPDQATATAYDFDALPAALTTAAAKFGGNHNYSAGYAKSISDIKIYTKSYVANLIAKTDVAVQNITYSDYVPSTSDKEGSIKITVKLAYGDKATTYYTDVVYTATLAVTNSGITVSPTSVGHEFLGYDTVTASKNFNSTPKTIEFNIKVAADELSGEMNILTNGSASVKLVDGKITVNDSLTASTTLSADTWTHVAITSDGKIYINGSLDVESSAISFNTSAPVIGKNFTGHLLDVRFWNDIRTASEISANITSRTDSDGLLAAWMLDADSYLWLEYSDASSNKNTATLKSTGWYKLEAGMQGDYSIIQFGDTQSYFAKEPYAYDRIPEMFKWMAENQDRYNIGYVTHLGDATQNNTRFEWDVTREAFDFIEGKIPYSITLGNHDYPSPATGVGAELRDSSMFRTTFTYDDYVASYGSDGMNTFGGTFGDEKDLTNMYSLVTIGGVDYIFFALEFAPRDAVLEWVGEVLTKYPERYAVISTHCYFSMNGTLTTEDSTVTEQFSDGNEGVEIYEKLITKYPQIILVTCGHSQGDETKQHPHDRGDAFMKSPTEDDFGGDVIQILADCSAYALDYPGNSTGFGADEGLIVMMMFTDGGKTMHTYVYSPLHDAYFLTINEETHTVKDIAVQPTLNVVGTELREETDGQPLGMRYKMTLSKSYMNFEDDIEIVGYGMVMLPEDVIPDGTEITADMFDGTDKAQYVLVEECSDTVFYEDDDRIDFTVVIHTVPDDDEGFAYSRNIAARGYVDYKVNGGDVVRLYSYKTLTCSMDSLMND